MLEWVATYIIKKKKNPEGSFSENQNNDLCTFQKFMQNQTTFSGCQEVCKHICELAEEYHTQTCISQ